MPIDWNLYDAYFRDSLVTQVPMSAATKESLSSEAAGLLEIPPETLATDWGECSQPGCYGIVIRLASTVAHRWNPEGSTAVGLKIFHHAGFGGAQAEKLVAFHTSARSRYPGLPNPQVQHVHAGGQLPRALTSEDKRRWYLVQEWIDGETWDGVLAKPVKKEMAEGMLRSLFEGVIFPLWSRGVVWWDIRDSNYCVRLRGAKPEVVMIDTDSLEAYHREILQTPEIHTLRNQKKLTGVKRLKTMVNNLAKVISEAHPGLVSRRETKHRYTAALDDFLMILSAPGPLHTPAAQGALERLVACLPG